jgi:threonine/homoserine/homoserine lactone efflux protein
MSLEMWLAFVVTSTVVLVIPGPTILTVMGYSVAHGRQAYLPIVTAIALGDLAAITLSLLGLGALLTASAVMFAVVKWAGGLYLLYLGIRLFRADVTEKQVVTEARAESSWHLFRNMLLVAFLNPKGIVFYVAFFPQFVDPRSDIGVQLSALALTFIVLGVLNSTLYAAFGASTRALLSTPRARRSFNIVGGSLLSASGVYAILARRASA